MIRFLLPVIVVLSPTAASAQALGHYVAVPAEGVRPVKVTTRGTAWFVRDGRLIAARAPETPARMCEMVAKKVGPLAAFTAAGRAFDAEALARCNAAAR